MKELKTKIKFLSDAHSIAEVKDGYSGATKFYFEKNGRKFFLKIGTFKTNPGLEEILKSSGIPHPKILDCGDYDETRSYIIEEFIDGKNLRDELQKYDKKFVYEFGFEIGSCYRNLRKIYPDKPVPCSLRDEYKISNNMQMHKLNNLLESDEKINPNVKKTITEVANFMKKSLPAIKNGIMVFGHTDIKPSNYKVCNGKVVAMDIENTGYKELSSSMLWSFARVDFKDTKNLAFARGYLDGLFDFDMPEGVLACFKHNYAFNMVNYFIRYLEDHDYEKLCKLTNHVKENYLREKNISIDEIENNSKRAKKIRGFGHDFSLVHGSYSELNLTFQFYRNGEKLFLKIMGMPKSDYNKALRSYKLMNGLKIPIGYILESGELGKNCFYIIQKYIGPASYIEKQDEYLIGLQKGRRAAEYLIKLKGQKIPGCKIYEKRSIMRDILKTANRLNGSIDLHRGKDELLYKAKHYIKYFEDEPISLIHGDVKLGNIIFGEKNSMFFADNESFEYSYDIVNFLYNIHSGFQEEKQKTEYKGFVNGYLKYMNGGKIPKRIQQQAKLLFIYYILRSFLGVQEEKGDPLKLVGLQKSYRYYIKEDNEVEWLK